MRLTFLPVEKRRGVVGEESELPHALRRARAAVLARTIRGHNDQRNRRRMGLNHRRQQFGCGRPRRDRDDDRALVALGPTESKEARRAFFEKRKHFQIPSLGDETQRLDHGSITAARTEHHRARTGDIGITEEL